MKIVHISEETVMPVIKKTPMYKDPVFMANLRRSIIESHNKRIRAKQGKQA